MERREAAPAKLNLYLHVTGRRADGYHELDSLIAFADIADTVIAAPAASLSLTRVGRFAGALGPLEDDLVWRAATKLAGHLGRAPNAALRLIKNLPVASGIGGGSSDAAATLRALVELWQVPLDQAALFALAVELGADVPVCLRAHTAWLGGIGEMLDPAPPLPPASVVLVNPGIALPTAPVFKARRGPFSRPARFGAAPRDAAGLAALIAARRNDLTDAAITAVPEIADVLMRLGREEGALIARMSGSGATCFALFADSTTAEAAAQRLRASEPRWWVEAGRLRP